MARHDITLTVNGEEQTLSVDSETLLVHALREELDYTGPKVGCQSTMCGACTVQLNGDPVKSCTLFAVQADGREVTTVEGLGDQDDLHPLQESFREEHGLQCGYCTPGMLMTADGLLEENPDPDREEIREALEGNICRCTGYENIVNAVESAAAKGEGGSDD
ncbi:carbon monoxide dehydrogenase [Halobacterium sp. DL1]|jgi:carbon-monoxide dehydrogenase small subunit|nr:carbon monoxide dehydrogenase [Halobacterium sp. DL1]